jgi:hypothetical protein
MGPGPLRKAHRMRYIVPLQELYLRRLQLEAHRSHSVIEVAQLCGTDYRGGSCINHANATCARGIFLASATSANALTTLSSASSVAVYRRAAVLSCRTRSVVDAAIHGLVRRPRANGDQGNRGSDGFRGTMQCHGGHHQGNSGYFAWRRNLSKHDCAYDCGARR